MASAGTCTARDLASLELWERSLARSRQRRRLSELARRARRRRKSISVAVSAALAAGPVLPRGIAAADSVGPGAGANTGAGAAQADGERVVLEMGSQGGLVAAVQRRLNEVLPITHVAVDGIFGPLTHGAVLDFQRRHGILATGSIDVRTWAILFKAPVLLLGTTSNAGSGTPAPSSAAEMARAASGAPTVARAGSPVLNSAPSPSAASGAGRGTRPSSEASAPQAALSPSGVARPISGVDASASPGTPAGTSIAIIAPSAPASQPSTYVLTNGVALPLPRAYVVNGYVDQGVDYSAPGGTPLYAMGDGVIIGEGISGFGPNTPVLRITSGPLKGLEVYYGHAGSNLVHVGDHVRAGQQISQVGDGIVGISTGPHLEIGFYPPGARGTGSRMLGLINGLLSQHPSGRSWGTRLPGSPVATPASVATRRSHSGSAARTPSPTRVRITLVKDTKPTSSVARRALVTSSAAGALPGGHQDASSSTSRTTTARDLQAPSGSASTNAAGAQPGQTGQTGGGPGATAAASAPATPPSQPADLAPAPAPIDSAPAPAPADSAPAPAPADSAPAPASTQAAPAATPDPATQGQSQAPAAGSSDPATQGQSQAPATPDASTQTAGG